MTCAKVPVAECRLTAANNDVEQDIQKALNDDYDSEGSDMDTDDRSGAFSTAHG
jgi:hypothetical protein